MRISQSSGMLECPYILHAVKSCDYASNTEFSFHKNLMLYTGQCHCGAIQFEVEAPEEIECQECNCSICQLTAYLHLIVPKSAFKLVRGHKTLTTYTFNTGVAKHHFCSICGIKAFYIPRSNPDGYDVNVRCLNPMPERITIEAFDGQNWEEHASELRHLSTET